MGGKANQAQGKRFEAAVRLMFKAFGYTVERVNEIHGYTKGWDLHIKELPKMVVQVKATKTNSDLMRGLREARKNNPKALAWVCFHSFRRPRKRPEIRVAYTNRREGPPSITDVPGFFHVLESGEYPSG
jgi:hypothetical protein